MEAQFSQFLKLATTEASKLVKTPTFDYVALAVLSYVALSVLFSFVSFVWTTFLRPGKNLKKYGKYAVVTGATDGIGLGYAKEFAKKGLNVVLISRTEEKLQATQRELKEKYPKVEISYVVADLAGGDSAVFEKIKSALKDLDIGVLVNNAGCSYDYAEYFHALSEKEIDQLIEFNVRALTRITHIVLPGMVSRKRGAIVNVGSAAGLVPVGDPLYTVYAGTKAYVDFFSRSLDLELRSKGIHVQCCVPYFVVSKLSKIRKASLATPTATNFAKSAVAAIGYEATVVPYWSHKIQHFVFTSLPDFVGKWYLLSFHIDLRKRALAKKPKQT